MPSFKISCLCGLFLTGLAACADTQDEHKETAKAVGPADGGETVSTKNTPKAKATLFLDDEEYELNFVMCMPGVGGATSVVASDSAKRANYPMVRATVFPEQTSDSVANTMSADFNNTDPRILWLRDTGVVEKTDTGLMASGTLKGSEMIKLPSVNAKPVPLSKDDVKSFQFEAIC